MHSVWRYVPTIVLLACQPKPPLQPSYFHAQRPENAPLDCKETLDCYAQCKPLVEECMLRCDQRGSSPEVARAREVSYCAARNNCSEQECTDQHCAAQMDACTAPRRGNRAG